jgi:hypothetical protein
MQVWFNIWKSINVIQHINRIKDKSNLITWIQAEKAFDKIQELFMLKVLMQLGIEGIYINRTKGTYDKRVANNVLNMERVKSFTLKYGMSQGCSLSSIVE